ncbi:MAG: glutaredoxin domain-containing protein [Polyangiaceae bacterium]
MKARAWLCIRLLALLVVVLAPAVACKKKAAAMTDPTPPPFKVSDASTGLLFTWVDAKGDFHVEQSAKDVPLEGRDVVRVVDPSREEGTHGDRIFIADLRIAGGDGSYPMKTTTLAEFDHVALARRQGKLPTLADDGGATTVPTAVATNDVPSNAGSGGGTDPVNTNHPTVIVYGASWCGPCHQAQAYLRKKNVPFVYNDIEKDSSAAREMQDKLRHAGMQAGSIPVIDVHGKIMVGFNAEEIDQALGTAL